MKGIVLVTGASGLVGTNLIDSLLEQDYKVIGISKSYFLKEKNLQQFQSKEYIPLCCDIRNIEEIKKIFQKYKPTIVVHLAAQAIVEIGISDMSETFDVNIRGTWNVLEVCKDLDNLNRVIIASSDKAYGEHLNLPYTEDYDLKAIYPYDVSKKITEQITMSYFHTYKLPVVITRCGNIFGPYDFNLSRIVPGTILSCLKKEKIRLRSDGQQKRCYVYAKDIANAYLKIIEAPLDKVKGQVFNIGNEEAISVLELTKTICRIMGVDFTSEIVIENTSKHEIPNQSLDCQRIKNRLGWIPDYSLILGLEETISWYRDNYKIIK